MYANLLGAAAMREFVEIRSVENGMPCSLDLGLSHSRL